jgi:transcriptional regulator of acetoin/glycerol metabolism
MIQKKKKRDKYFVSKKLREQKKSNDFFELMLANITLEDLICLKFEVAHRSSPVTIEGFPVWKAANHIICEALLKYALSANGTKTNAGKLLGMSNRSFHDNLKRYNLSNFLEEKVDDTNRRGIEKNIP